MDSREEYWIHYYDTFNTTHGYNCTSGGGNCYEISDETRAKISASESGENNHYFGKHLSPEHRAKIGDAQRGHRGNMYGKHHTTKQIEMVKLAESIPIIAFTDMQDVYMYYLSSMSAQRIDKFSSGHISKCINGKRKSAYKTTDGEPIHWRKATCTEADVITKYFLKTGHEKLSPHEFTQMQKEDSNYAYRSA